MLAIAIPVIKSFFQHDELPYGSDNEHLRIVLWALEFSDQILGQGMEQFRRLMNIWPQDIFPMAYCEESKLQNRVKAKVESEKTEKDTSCAVVLGTLKFIPHK